MKLLTKKEVAEMLGVSVRSVDSYRQSAGLPFIVIGGAKLVRFQEQAVLDWISQKDNDCNKPETAMVK